MTFQFFSAKDALKIDIANNFGLDKKNYDERIAWFDENIDTLPQRLHEADAPALVYAGLQAWDDAQHGIPSGYPITVDATSSGIQILAAMTGDRKAAELCNIIDNGKRNNAYQILYEMFMERVGGSTEHTLDDVKRAIMTAFYGSVKEPRQIFGEGEMLEAFFKLMNDACPGPWELNEFFLKIWDKNALRYDWVLPDNFHAGFKVEGTVAHEVEAFGRMRTILTTENMPTKRGRALSANVTHSVDGMVVREMARRCSYDAVRVAGLLKLKGVRAFGKRERLEDDRMVQTLWGHYLDSGFLSARIIDHLCAENAGLVDMNVVFELLDSLPAKPFNIITIHDAFRCLPNYFNDLRQQYNNILSSLARSETLSFIVSQLLKEVVQIGKYDADLWQDIQHANYALT